MLAGAVECLSIDAETARWTKAATPRTRWSHWSAVVIPKRTEGKAATQKYSTSALSHETDKTSYTAKNQ